MLYIDSARTGAGKVTKEFFVWWWILVGIRFQDFEHTLGLWFETRLCNLFGVFLCLFGKDQLPAYHSTASSHSSTGVFIPSVIDSRIPGIDVRYNVS